MVAVSLKKKLKGDSSRTHEVGQSHPYRLACISLLLHLFFFFKQKTAYEIGLGIPAEPLFRSSKLVSGNTEIIKAYEEAKRELGILKKEAA